MRPDASARRCCPAGFASFYLHPEGSRRLPERMDRKRDLPAEAPASGVGPWLRLRSFTSARIGLSRTGASLATRPTLEFRLAHARARDALYDVLDHARLSDDAGAHPLYCDG